jgi:hypothetical protein
MRNPIFKTSNDPTMDLAQQWERSVYCPFCRSIARLKPTKTNKLMLRCDGCGLLAFANAKYSQQYFLSLHDYQQQQQHPRTWK